MKMFPLDVVFSYTVKPYDADGKFVQLVALNLIGRKSSYGG